MKRILIGIFIMAGSLCFGQLDSNSVTVSVSQTSTPQPDEGIIQITVNSGYGSSLNDIVAALQGVGVTAASFNGLSSGYALNGTSQVLQWSFQIEVPLTQLKASLTSLTSLEQTIGQNNSGLQLSFNVGGTAYSQQLLQSQSCTPATLIAAARSQAQQLASAAGMTAGQILALSTSAALPAVVVTGLLLGSVSAPNCSLTVKFALGAP